MVIMTNHLQKTNGKILEIIKKEQPWKKQQLENALTLKGAVSDHFECEGGELEDRRRRTPSFQSSAYLQGRPKLML